MRVDKDCKNCPAFLSAQRLLLGKKAWETNIAQNAEMVALTRILLMFYPASIEEIGSEYALIMDTPVGQLAWRLGNGAIQQLPGVPCARHRVFDGHTSDENVNRVNRLVMLWQQHMPPPPPPLELSKPPLPSFLDRPDSVRQ